MAGSLAGRRRAVLDRRQHSGGAPGARDANDALANLRITWGADLAGAVEPGRARRGQRRGRAPVVIARAEAGVLPTPPLTLFDLTGVIVDRDDVRMSDTIDRLLAGLFDTELRGPRRTPGDHLGQRAGVPGRWICSTRSRRSPPIPSGSPASTCSMSNACLPTAPTCRSSVAPRESLPPGGSRSPATQPPSPCIGAERWPAIRRR